MTKKIYSHILHWWMTCIVPMVFGLFRLLELLGPLRLVPVVVAIKWSLDPWTSTLLAR